MWVEIVAVEKKPCMLCPLVYVYECAHVCAPVPLAGPPHMSERAYVVVAAALLAVYLPDTRPQLTCSGAQHDVLSRLKSSKPVRTTWLADKTAHTCWVFRKRTCMGYKQ